MLPDVWLGLFMLFKKSFPSGTCEKWLWWPCQQIQKISRSVSYICCYFFCVLSNLHVITLTVFSYGWEQKIFFQTLAVIQNSFCFTFSLQVGSQNKFCSTQSSYQKSHVLFKEIKNVRGYIGIPRLCVSKGTKTSFLLLTFEVEELILKLRYTRVWVFIECSFSWMHLSFMQTFQEVKLAITEDGELF